MKLDLKKIRLSLLSLCTLAGIMFVGLKGCKHESLHSETVGDVPNLPVLREVVRHKARLPKTYVPPEATVTITPKDPTKTLDEIINVKFRTYGFCFKPGIQAALPLGVGLDAKLGFYSKYGFGVAGLVGKRSDGTFGTFHPAVFGSRHFERFNNLEAVAGIKFKFTGIDSPYVGLRLSF